MKKIILCIILALIAIWGAFYTENLTEKHRREQLAQVKPDELVSIMMNDSLSSLEERAITLEQLKEGFGDETFARQHGHVLGIGSPTFYMIKDEAEHATTVGNEIHATAEGLQLTIPLKHIFGNTAREASGWFDIDNFQNTTDFNAVSAAMNTYIAAQLKTFVLNAEGEVEFLAGVAIAKDAQQLTALTLIPFKIKNE